jgi:TonB family protein
MRSAKHRLPILFAGIILLAGLPVVALAQNSLEMDEIANRTASQLIKINPKILLIAPRETCNLALYVCGMFDSALRSDLQQAVPGLQFIGGKEAVNDLKRNGFFAIDAYNPMALRLVALSTNSEVIVTEDILWEKDGYTLRIDIRDSKTGQRVVPFGSLQIKAARLIPDSPDNPLLVVDPDANVSVIVFKGPMPNRFVYPRCDRCPDPKSIGSAGLVEAIGTITPQGKVESVSIVSSPSPFFTKAALDTLQGWRFRPAVGLDGKAFATRQSIEVNFSH